MFTAWDYTHYNDDVHNPLRLFPIIETVGNTLEIPSYFNTLSHETFMNYGSLRKICATVFKMVTQKALSFSISNINRVDNIYGVVQRIKHSYEQESDPAYIPEGSRRIVNIYYVYRDINNVFNYLDTELGRVSTEHPTGDLMGVSIGFKEDRYHRVRLYKTSQLVYVFTNQRPTNNFVRRLYAIIPMLFDKDFNTENTLAVDVFKNIIEPHNVWIHSIKAWVDENLDEAKINAEAIKSIFSKALQSQKATVESNLTRLRHNVDSYLTNYSRALKELERHNHMYQRMYDTDAESKIMNEFLDFITDKEKNSCKLNKVGDKLRLDIVTPLTNYSVAEADNIIRRQISDPALRQLMKDIFVEQKYTLYMSSSIYWDIMACYRGDNPVHSERYSTMCATGMPNPHHYYYSCYGDNTPAVVKAMQHGQYIAAYLQLKASVGSFNWTDGPVASNFLSAIIEFDEHYVDAADSIKDNETDKFYTLRELYNEYSKGAEE